MFWVLPKQCSQLGPPQREYIFHRKRERKAPNGDNHRHQTWRLIVRGVPPSLCSEMGFAGRKDWAGAPCVVGRNCFVPVLSGCLKSSFDTDWSDKNDPVRILSDRGFLGQFCAVLSLPTLLEAWKMWKPTGHRALVTWAWSGFTYLYDSHPRVSGTFLKGTPGPALPFSHRESSRLPGEAEKRQLLAPFFPGGRTRGGAGKGGRLRFGKVKWLAQGYLAN